MADDTGTWDKVKGKANQVAGDVRGDKSQSIKGHAQEGKGDVKGAMNKDRDRDVDDV